MSRTIHLHIGLGKTGTSYLQTFFALNADRLARRGILYPQDRSTEAAKAGAITSGNGVKLAKYLNPNLPHKFDIDEARAEVFTQLRSENIRAILYSSEYLSAAVEVRLREFLDACRHEGYRVSAVCYVRPQDEVYVSAYSQEVKRGGEKRSLDEFIKATKFHYLQGLIKFENALGSENFHVRVYSARRFTGHELAIDICGALGFPVDIAWDFPCEKINPALRMKEANIMRVLNRVDDVGDARFGIADWLAKVPELVGDPELLAQSPPLTLERKQAENIGAMYAEENEKINERFFGGTPGLVVDVDGYPEQLQWVGEDDYNMYLTAALIGFLAKKP